MDIWAKLWLIERSKKNRAEVKFNLWDEKWFCNKYLSWLMKIDYLNIKSYRWQGDTTVEPRHDKTNKMIVRPAKTQISLAYAQSEQSLRLRSMGS